MPIQTTTKKNSMAVAYGSDTDHGALFTTAGGATAGTEVTGGTPPYARKPLVWSAPTNGVITASATFDVPAGTTVRGTGLFTELTGGVYLDGNAVTETTFTVQDTVTVTFTATVA